MNLEWKQEMPTEEGFYWFWGERYKPFINDEAQNELIFCTVHKISNGSMIVGNGQIFYKSELGKNWFFAKTKIPNLPKLSGKIFEKLIENELNDSN